MRMTKPLASLVLLALAVFGLSPLQAAYDYGPRLADIMVNTQLRHLKLWFAGRQKNWELADYELAQIEASFNDAANLFPGVPLTDMAVVSAKAKIIGEAIKAKDEKAFTAAFSEMTAACNQCHQANGRGFIVIKVPTASPYSNQEFQAPPGTR